MNGWDIFTYLMCGVLAVRSVTIFALFLRDAGDILRGNRGQDEESDDWD